MVKICAFTGYRPKNLPWGYRENDLRCVAFKERLLRCVDFLVSKGFTHFISGAALGFDTYAAEAVIQLKKNQSSVQLEMAVPFDGQANGWRDIDKVRRAHIFEQADLVTHIAHVYDSGVYYRRNLYMVQKADMILAAFDGKPGGTQETINLAKEHGVTVKRILLIKEAKSNG